MGYTQRTVRFEFPAISEPDDLCYVVLRSPKLAPVASFEAMGNIARDAKGVPTNPKEALLGASTTLSSMVLDWHVYDATSDDEPQPLLPLPATAESVAKLPTYIASRLMEALGDAINPNP